ncbi:MFS transporter [Streptomyces sasae]|uniref:hypothetical protein n=1 Tax=Streptomyces sasae TaxID=1266772 RepID=UPI00292E3C03|nr:hypothetical protein [Streptomyces sasae]
MVDSVVTGLFVPLSLLYPSASSGASLVWVGTLLSVAVLCYSAAQLVHSPVSNALSADAAPAEIRGRYIAVFQYSFAIATVVAPLLFSLLLDMSSAAPWITLAALALATVPGMLALAPRLPHAASATGAAGRSAA